MAKASDLFIDQLEAEGVEYIFGIPGEENLDLLDSLSRSDSIRLILTRHEQAAGFMAATYGRLTGRAGVCLSTRATLSRFGLLRSLPFRKLLRNSWGQKFACFEVNEAQAESLCAVTEVAERPGAMLGLIGLDSRIGVVDVTS